MRIRIPALVLVGVFCAAVPAMHAQAKDCTPPPADPNLTPEQQKAAAGGYRVACESVKAFKKRAAEPKPAAGVDEYVPDLYFPRMRPNATLQDYMKWLDTERDSCPNLVRQARVGLAGFPSDVGKVEFLKTIQTLVTTKRACE